MPESLDVDLVLNVFERTYRTALESGAVRAIEEANRRRFARRVVLINNVEAQDDACARADRLVRSGEIDEWHLVSDCVNRALEVTGLRRAELEPLLRYSDYPLVAVTLPGRPWLLYWDPEAKLQRPVDWVGPGLDLMARDRRVMVANPSWEVVDASGRRPGVEQEAVEIRGDFALGPGFSDQVFLCRRADFATPMYNQRCIGRIVHPAAHRAHVFEPALARTCVTTSGGGRRLYRPRTSRTRREDRLPTLLTVLWRRSGTYGTPPC